MYLIANILMSVSFVMALNLACLDLDSIQADHWWYRLLHSWLITVATVFATSCHVHFQISLAMLIVTLLSLGLNFILDSAYAGHQCAKSTHKALQVLLSATLVILLVMYEGVSLI